MEVSLAKKKKKKRGRETRAGGVLFRDRSTAEGVE